jgi:hypothetical protein
MAETPDEARGPDEDRRRQENDPTAVGPQDRQQPPPDDEDDDGLRLRELPACRTAGIDGGEGGGRAGYEAVHVPGWAAG